MSNEDTFKGEISHAFKFARVVGPEEQAQLSRTLQYIVALEKAVEAGRTMLSESPADGDSNSDYQHAVKEFTAKCSFIDELKEIQRIASLPFVPFQDRIEHVFRAYGLEVKKKDRRLVEEVSKLMTEAVAEDHDKDPSVTPFQAIEEPARLVPRVTHKRDKT